MSYKNQGGFAQKSLPTQVAQIQETQYMSILLSQLGQQQTDYSKFRYHLPYFPLLSLNSTLIPVHSETTPGVACGVGIHYAEVGSHRGCT